MADALGPRKVREGGATQSVVGGVHELPEQGGAVERCAEVGQRRIITRGKGLSIRRLAFSTMNAAGLAKADLIMRTATKTPGSMDMLWSIV